VLAGQLRPEGIRVNSIALGTVLTAHHAALYSGDTTHFERLQGTTLLGRLVTPDEAAAAYIALARDLTALTGTTIICDAGQSIRFAF
jgi:NAD(P)-dependent dehydrogenase (short-subunit alcohol dehydrogenase family)